MYQSEVAPLRRVLLKHARDAYVAPDRIAEQWRGLSYGAPPEIDAACRESDALAELLSGLGVIVEWMPASDAGLDSIYVRDASVVSDAGAVLCNMGKPARAGEPALLGDAYEELGIHVRGAIRDPGRLEGGDVVWLAPDWLAVGTGRRTNRAGVEQLRDLVPDDVEVTGFALPDVGLPGDVFHLMSVLSPLDADLTLVHPPLLPDDLEAALRARGFELLAVPEGEFDRQGCNVFAVGPREVLALDGCPRTRAVMEAAGVTVHVYQGTEISVKGWGGPTCLTRPLERALA